MGLTVLLFTVHVVQSLLFFCFDIVVVQCKSSNTDHRFTKKYCAYIGHSSCSAHVGQGRTHNAHVLAKHSAREHTGKLSPTSHVLVGQCQLLSISGSTVYTAQKKLNPAKACMSGETLETKAAPYKWKQHTATFRGWKLEWLHKTGDRRQWYTKLCSYCTCVLWFLRGFIITLMFPSFGVICYENIKLPAVSEG